MPAEHRILVTGATGNTGSMVLQELATRGARVRALVRDQSGGGRLPVTSAETVVGNFDDPRSLDAALEGVTHAYLVTRSSPDAQEQTGAIRRTGRGRGRQASREALTARSR
jgi:uncharacterized protein YbjT (DUF2867 family)